MCTAEFIPQTSMNLSELSEYFHLPISDAAQELRMCPTVLKKICRKNGVNRWPHRKIKSIDSLIDSLQQLIDSTDGEVPTLNMDMEVLLEKKRFLLANPNVAYKSVVPKYSINSFRAQIQKAKEDRKENQSAQNLISLKPNLPTATKSIIKKTNFKSKSSSLRKSLFPEQFTTAEAASTLACLHTLSNVKAEPKTDFESLDNIGFKYNRVINSKPAFSHLPFQNLLRMSG